MPNTGGNQTAFFNDGGVGHGGFVANFNTAGQVILDPFSPKYPSKTIAQGNQIGAPLKQASVNEFPTATATAQIPVDNTGNNPTFIVNGDYFIAPANYGGGKWYVDDVGETFQSGQFWKAELNLRLAING
jgi:hypothetical protein